MICYRCFAAVAALHDRQELYASSCQGICTLNGWVACSYCEICCLCRSHYGANTLLCACLGAWCCLCCCQVEEQMRGNQGMGNSDDVEMARMEAENIQLR